MRLDAHGAQFAGDRRVDRRLRRARPPIPEYGASLRGQRQRNDDVFGRAVLDTQRAADVRETLVEAHEGVMPPPARRAAGRAQARAQRVMQIQARHRRAVRRSRRKRGIVREAQVVAKPDEDAGC